MQKSITPSEYDRLKSISSKQYFSDLWEEMRKKKKEYKISRRKPRLILLGVFLITFLFLNSKNELIITIGVILAVICFFLWIREFLSAHSHFEATWRRHGLLKVIKENIDGSQNYEDYFSRHEAKHIR